MTDQNSQFFAILTAVGEAKQANANALGVPWTFAQMGVGDANNTDPVPSRTQTTLINERRRAPLNQLTIDPKDASVIIAEQVIPPDIGGWWIREIGLYDAAGDLVAVANCAPSYKPLLAQGTGKTQVVRLNLVVSSSANVQLKIDPAVVLATREYVDNSIVNVLPKNKVVGTFTKVRINDRGVVQEGSNPTTLAGYSIVDAMPKGAGGLMTAPAAQAHLDNLHATQFFTVDQNTAGKPVGLTYGAGFHVEYPGGYYGFEFLGGVMTDWFAARHIGGDGGGVWRSFWHDGNFNPALKADKAVTLAGYGIADAYTKAQTNQQVSDATAALRGGVGAGYDTLQKIALDLVKKPDRAATLAGYGITDAYTQTQTNQQVYDATTALRGGVGAGYDTLQKIALDLVKKPDKAATLAGYGITDAYTKTAANTLLAEKFAKSGGTISGTVLIDAPDQTQTAAGFVIQNPTTGGWSGLTLSGPTGAGNIFYQSTGNTLFFRNHVTDFAHIDAGDILSNSQRVHTVKSFMMPVAGQWVALNGVTGLPASGTWAFSLTTYNGGGLATGCATGVVAGGTTVGSTYTLGFAWRIF